MAVLCYISGYVAKKAYGTKKCEECKAFVMSEDTIQLEIDEECLKYIDDLNRGGLLYMFMIYLIYAYLNMKLTLLNVHMKRM